MILSASAPLQRALVVIAHPDDEVLGCGATIAKLAQCGVDVKVLLAARRSDTRNWEARTRAFASAAELLGATPVLLDPSFDATRGESHLHDLHEAVEPWIEWSQAVFTHWHGDVHQLHRSVSRAVEVATRPFRRRRDVYLFEIPSSTDQGYTGASFTPNCHVVVEESHCALKRAAMALYPEEHASGRHPDDLERRLRLRGAEAGVEHAEAFVVARVFG